MNQSASVHQLMKIKDVDKNIAQAVRMVWNTKLIPSPCDNATEIKGALVKLFAGKGGNRSLLSDSEWVKLSAPLERFITSSRRAPLVRAVKRFVIDKLIDTHGVEYLGVARGTGSNVYYCNTGDTYATTIVFNGNILRVATMGDCVESGYIKRDHRYDF